MNTKKSPYRFENASIVTHESVCAPAVRVTVLYCSYIPEEKRFFESVHQVIAVKSTRAENFFKRYHEDDPKPKPSRNSRQLEEDGWQFDHADSQHSYLIHDEEYGLIEHDDSLMTGCGEAVGVVVLPWPADPVSDTERFEKTFQLLRKEAQQISERREKEANQPKAIT